jgi:hypothetical protein
MSAEVTETTDSTMQRYESLDEKVDLLLERMSICLDLVRNFIQENNHPGYMLIFGLMIKFFPLRLEKLQDIQSQLKTAHLKWSLRSKRDTALQEACDTIYQFHNNKMRFLEDDELLKHIGNETQNLSRLQKNLDPKKEVDGLTTVDTQGGVMLKILNVETGEIVVIEERISKTLCAVCWERPRDVVLLPCLHYFLCKKCSSRLSRCSVCRKRTIQAIDIETARTDGIPYIQSTHFPEYEGCTRRLLMELQALASREN